jgi:protein-tyrosine-phosphatase
VGIAKSGTQKLVLFVSHGGTCRCAMSKIVANRAFAGRLLPFRLRFESMAAKFGNAVNASYGARQAIKDAFGEDLLESHRVMKRNDGIVEDADLILVMEESLMTGLPIGKTRLITEFFGDHGTVRNPWQDNDDAGARDRYRDCLAQLRLLIESHGDKLIQALT